MYSHCRHGDWILGNLIDGTQAEYVRIPYADGSLCNFPSGEDEEAMVMLSNILSRCCVESISVNGGPPIRRKIILQDNMDVVSRKTSYPKRITAKALRILPGLVSGWGCPGQRLSKG
jgi:hypothetical protein